MTPVEQALPVFMDVLHLALVAAVGVFALSAVWLVSGAISRRLEDRYLPHVVRWSRRRAGVGEDAGPWACPACRSVNPPTGMSCYRCGGPRVEGALELVDIAADDTVFHHPDPRNRFDPSLYRGPGAPPDGAGGALDGTAEVQPDDAGGVSPEMLGRQVRPDGLDGQGAAGSPVSPQPSAGPREPVR